MRTNGYLLVRLEQLGWQPRRTLLLGLALRSSYHIHYGIGVFTVELLALQARQAEDGQPPLVVVHVRPHLCVLGG